MRPASGGRRAWQATFRRCVVTWRPLEEDELMRVLVVEDEERLAAHITDGLRDQGMAVDVTYNGDEALDKIQMHGSYDLVVLDRALPGRPGDDICRELGGS